MGFRRWRKIAKDKDTSKLTLMEPGSDGTASGEERKWFLISSNTLWESQIYDSDLGTSKPQQNDTNATAGHREPTVSSQMWCQVVRILHQIIFRRRGDAMATSAKVSHKMWDEKGSDVSYASSTRIFNVWARSGRFLHKVITTHATRAVTILFRYGISDTQFLEFYWWKYVTFFSRCTVAFIQYVTYRNFA
jgi:hypothetical protein